MTNDISSIQSEQMTDAVSGYFETRRSVFISLFEKTKLFFSVEDLHQLRVEIKKQRAFIRFLEILSNGEYASHDHKKLLAIIFKPGGNLRETQVNQALILRYRSYTLKGYKKFLFKKSKRQLKKLIKAFGAFQLEHYEYLTLSIYDVLDAYSYEEVTVKSAGFIDHELMSIEELRNQIESDKDLHQIRTHTKALGYIAKFLNSLAPSQSISKLFLLSKPTEKLIGNWHDRVVLRSSLQCYIHKNPNAPDLFEVEKLIRQINRTNRSFVRNIAGRLDGLINFRISDNEH